MLFNQIDLSSERSLIPVYNPMMNYLHYYLDYSVHLFIWISKLIPFILHLIQSS